MLSETEPPSSDLACDPVDHEPVQTTRELWNAVVHDYGFDTLFVSYLAYAGLRPCHQDVFQILARRELKNWSFFLEDSLVSPSRLISWGVPEGLAIGLNRMAPAFFRHIQKGDYLQFLGGDEECSGGLWGRCTCKDGFRGHSPAGSVLI